MNDNLIFSEFYGQYAHEYYWEQKKKLDTVERLIKELEDKREGLKGQAKAKVTRKLRPYMEERKRYQDWLKDAQGRARYFGYSETQYKIKIELTLDNIITSSIEAIKLIADAMKISPYEAVHQLEWNINDIVQAKESQTWAKQLLRIIKRSLEGKLDPENNRATWAEALIKAYDIMKEDLTEALMREQGTAMWSSSPSHSVVRLYRQEAIKNLIDDYRYGLYEIGFLRAMLDRGLIVFDADPTTPEQEKGNAWWTQHYERAEVKDA